MTNQLDTNVGMLLTAGSILKIWLIEFIMMEFVIALLVFARSPVGIFVMSLGDDLVASSGDKIADFIVISIISFFITALLSVFLWIGQGALSWIMPLSFNLR